MKVTCLNNLLLFIDDLGPRGGGFKYFLFSPLFGESFQFDSYFSDGLKPSAFLGTVAVVALLATRSSLDAVRIGLAPSHPCGQAPNGGRTGRGGPLRLKPAFWRKKNSMKSLLQSLSELMLFDQIPQKAQQVRGRMRKTSQRKGSLKTSNTVENTPLWREAHFQVKMHKTPHSFFQVPISKNGTPLWREEHLQLKMSKTPLSRATFWSSDVEKLVS